MQTVWKQLLLWSEVCSLLRVFKLTFICWTEITIVCKQMLWTNICSKQLGMLSYYDEKMKFFELRWKFSLSGFRKLGRGEVKKSPTIIRGRDKSRQWRNTRFSLNFVIFFCHSQDVVKISTPFFNLVTTQIIHARFRKNLNQIFQATSFSKYERLAQMHGEKRLVDNAISFTALSLT